MDKVTELDGVAEVAGVDGVTVWGWSDWTGWSGWSDLSGWSAWSKWMGWRDGMIWVLSVFFFTSFTILTVKNKWKCSRRTAASIFIFLKIDSSFDYKHTIIIMKLCQSTLYSLCGFKIFMSIFLSFYFRIILYITMCFILFSVLSKCSSTLFNEK